MFCGGRYPSTLVNTAERRASSSRSSYNRFAPHKNEQWIDFSVQLARTTGGRLNDYFTTTPLQLLENNNQSLGRILWPIEIKGEWDQEKEREGGMEREREGGRQISCSLSRAASTFSCVSVTSLCCSVQSQATSG